MKRTILVCLLLVFALAQSAHAQTVVTLYTFTGNCKTGNGCNPTGGMVMDASGNLYGTTALGGANGVGSVFKITPSGAETILYSFLNNGVDGATPNGSLLMDSQGNLYGTTMHGGTDPNLGGVGTVFKVAPDGTETILHSFSYHTNDGAEPLEGVILDSHGNLYGTTLLGGGSGGQGTIFKIAPGNVETVLHSFSGADGARPGGGASPGLGRLTMDSAGNLYDATYAGGAYNFGTVFKLDPATDTYTVLHNFNSNGTDGASPMGGLAIDSVGNLYGTTGFGGVNSNGTIFQISPDGTESILLNFGGSTEIQSGTPGLLLDKQNNLYGVTQTATVPSGASSGAVFRFSLQSKFLTILNTFPLIFHSGNLDGQPEGDLITDSSGNLYGVTASGANDGTVYKLTPNPVVGLSSSFAAFGKQIIDVTSTAQIVQLNNVGVGPLTLTAQLTGPNAPEFAESDSCQNVPPSGICSLSFQFTPASVGSAAATLVLTDPAGDVLPTVALTGIGTPAAPVFSPTPGSYAANQLVTISDSTAGAVIYYAINGGVPVQYAGPVTLTATDKFQAAAAFATPSGYVISPTVGAQYTVIPPPATPLLSLATGTYTGSQQLTITDATTAAGIYYTINGGSPIPYTGMITIGVTETIKARAYEVDTSGGYVLSTPVSAMYTIH